MIGIIKTGVASLIATVAFTAAPVGAPYEYSAKARADIIPEFPKEQVIEASPEVEKYSGIREGAHGGQCVEWLKNYLGTYVTDPNFKGHARDIGSNSNTPMIGSVVLTSEGPGHAALIIDIEDHELILAESNYEGDERITVGRRLMIGDPEIRGYYKFQ